MSQYTELVNLLQNKSRYGWSILNSPEPSACQVAFDAGTSTEDVAAILQAFVLNASKNPPYNLDMRTAFAGACHDLFQTNCHWWKLNTRVALGQTQDYVPEPSAPVATTAKAWNDNLYHGYGREGYLGVCDAATWEQRKATASQPDPEWVDAGRSETWSLITLADVRVTLNEIRKLDVQQFVDQVVAKSMGMGLDASDPLPWDWATGFPIKESRWWTR